MHISGSLPYLILTKYSWDIYFKAVECAILCPAHKKGGYNTVSYPVLEFL
jgi:hypothetical protein